MSHAENALIAAQLVLEEVLAREAMAELVRVGPFVKDHLHDRAHQDAIVSSATHNIRPLCQLLELAL